MNGHIIPGTPIAVDFWDSSRIFKARLFFLTHLHADHTKGLTSSWRFPIYTSSVNAALLSLKFKFLEGKIQKLEIGETYQIPMDDDGEHLLSVTPLDANHVPGAVMFLFQGYFGNYLYCGDMRWYPELLKNPVLKSVVELRELDCVYLDNTFSAPYCRFPSREKAMKQVFYIIDGCPHSVIKIGVRSLGKEDVLEAVAHRYLEKILVDQEKYNSLQVLQRFDVYTTNPRESRIHAVPFRQITSKAHAMWNETAKTTSIILTALFAGWLSGPYSSSYTKGLHVVPYSDHSSYTELMEMVETLAPKKVVPIVTSWSSAGWWSDPAAPNQLVKGDMTIYDHLLTPSQPDCKIIPKSVEETMKSRKSNNFHHEFRRDGLRRGKNLLKSRRTSIVPYGVRYSSSESIIASPEHTPRITDDANIPSPSSTPSHDGPSLNNSDIGMIPKKFVKNSDIPGHRAHIDKSSLSLETFEGKIKPCKRFSHENSTNENILSCINCGTQKLVSHQKLSKRYKTKVESLKDRARKTQEIRANCTHCSSVSEKARTEEILKYESLLICKKRLSELVSELKFTDNDGLIELSDKANVFCEVMDNLNSLF